MALGAGKMVAPFAHQNLKIIGKYPIFSRYAPIPCFFLKNLETAKSI